MGNVSNFEREKLFCGILYKDESMLLEALYRLSLLYGEIEYVSDVFSFSDLSEYYSEEMGGDVFRRFVSFADLKAPDRITEIKRETNAIEAEMSHDGKRCVNLDPGLIGRGTLLLPTTKSAPHRIAMSDGIYVELTLFYSSGDYTDFPWTYRDYKSREVKDVMLAIRKKYMRQRREMLNTDENR